MEQQRMRRSREPELLSMNIAEAEFCTISSEKSSTAVILTAASLFRRKSTSQNISQCNTRVLQCTQVYQSKSVRLCLETQAAAAEYKRVYSDFLQLRLHDHNKPITVGKY